MSTASVVTLVIVAALVALAAGCVLAIAWQRRVAGLQHGFGVAGADAAERAATQAVQQAAEVVAVRQAQALAEMQTAQSASQTEALQRGLRDAVAALQVQAASERDQAVRTALEQVAVMGRETLGSQHQAASADLAAKKDVIEARLGQIEAQVHTDLERLTTLVGQLQHSTSERFGQVDSSLRAHAEITQHLTSTTQGLREALASPNARGQWGERMAEDILRAAGFIEHKQYRKRTAVDGDGSGIPDFTFFMPKGQVLFMDVKFPMAAYLRYLDASTDAERSTHRATFLRDVRQRVRELAKRDYAATDDRAAVDNVLLFVPN
ncbi:MAG TPA: DNA recombination protein RmuC, partial [Ilumatobacteraceae bacterium]|nr:DNA recombination protein RmuC [Ilumatobacteraceae bacterium]